MVLERGREGLRGLGHADLAQKVADVQNELARRSGMTDLPLRGKLPQLQESRTEVVALPPLSPETQRLVEHMQNNGYAIYDTIGKTPVSLKKEGMRYWYLNPALENVTASPALLAFKFKPEEFFLPGSKNIPHEEQLKLLPGEQVRVDKQYPDAGLVVREGKLPEWTELALRHFKETSKIGRGVRIFGKDYDYAYTWTDTYESDQPGASRAFFGRWGGADGAVARLWDPAGVNPHLGLASLVEIHRK